MGCSNALKDAVVVPAHYTLCRRRAKEVTAVLPRGGIVDNPRAQA